MTARLREIDSSEQLGQVVDLSRNAPIVVFKHSTSCGISSSVLNEIRSLETEIHVVVVQNSRPVSNEIESRFGIRHETPQVIVLSHGTVIYHASHYDVSSDEIAALMGTEVRV